MIITIRSRSLISKKIKLTTILCTSHTNDQNKLP